MLFLVDRRALAAQAVRAFNSFDAETNLKFTGAYELYSSRFQREDFGDEERLDIPIHAFDLIVADECHRGYTSQELSAWRATLDHFDAIKIGLTATPAAHTAAYFTHKAFADGYEQAVREGHLVDYDAVNVRSEVRMGGKVSKHAHGLPASSADASPGAAAARWMSPVGAVR